MTITITTSPNEKGAAFVTIIPTDSEGVVLTIGQLNDPKWQLMQFDTKKIINNRSFALSSLISLEVLLKGDDLAIFSAESGKRIFAIECTYNSTDGNNIPLTEECEFNINALYSQVNEPLLS